MEILEFRYITKNDIFNDSYGHWSRKYEYDTVIDYIKKYHTEGSKIHNTSWGCSHHNWFDTCHLPFKEKLDNEFSSDNVTHSDIFPSNLPGTVIYDITKPPNEDFESKFDIVVNISALEEIPGNHIEYLNNLFYNLKDGGYLIVTFDLPGFQLEDLEESLETKISMEGYDERIVGYGGPVYNNLNVGLLIVKNV